MSDRDAALRSIAETLAHDPQLATHVVHQISASSAFAQLLADLEARVAELERALDLRDPERLVGTAEASRNYSVSQDELRRHPARYGGRKLGGRWKFPAKRDETRRNEDTS